MNLFWIFYYLMLLGICNVFSKTNNNKFINYFFNPIIFSFFGSVWFINPGSSELAPIFSILFLELSIIESNGITRLIRPLLASIFLFQSISLVYYFYGKRDSKMKRSL